VSAEVDDRWGRGRRVGGEWGGGGWHGRAPDPCRGNRRRGRKPGRGKLGLKGKDFNGAGQGVGYGGAGGVGRGKGHGWQGFFREGVTAETGGVLSVTFQLILGIWRRG